MAEEDMESLMMLQLMQRMQRPSRAWVYVLIALVVVALLAYQFVPEFRNIINPILPVKKLYLIASVYADGIGSDTQACMENECPSPPVTHFDCPVIYRFRVTVTNPDMNVYEWERELRVKCKPTAIVGCVRPNFASGMGYAKFSVLTPKKGSYGFDIKLHRKTGGLWVFVGRSYITYEVV